MNFLVSIKQKRRPIDIHNKTEGSDKKARNVDLVKNMMEVELNRGIWAVQALELEKTARRGLMQTNEEHLALVIWSEFCLEPFSCNVSGGVCLGCFGELGRFVV